MKTIHYILYILIKLIDYCLNAKDMKLSDLHDIRSLENSPGLLLGHDNKPENSD